MLQYKCEDCCSVFRKYLGRKCKCGGEITPIEINLEKQTIREY